MTATVNEGQITTVKYYKIKKNVTAGKGKEYLSKSLRADFTWRGLGSGPAV